MTESPGLLLTLLSFAAVIGPLVFVHEMGHYLMARLFGIHAETFSMGFGKEIAHWHDKRGTRWRLAALPLGGYVKFAGDMNAASQSDPEWLALPAEERARTFQSKPVWQRALVVLAGPLTNFLFAILILAGFAMAYGENVTSAEVGGVRPDGAAAAAGVLTGDRIIAIDGAAIDRFEQLSRAVVGRPGETIALTVERRGRPLALGVTIGTRIERDRFGNAYRFGQLGVTSRRTEVRPVSPLAAPVIAVRQVGAIVTMMVDGLGQVITGRRSVDELGGPLKIAQISGEQAARGPADFIFFIALISINLGFINLLPIPMLDGGHLLFQGIEALQRKPVSPRIQELAYRSGLALLLAVMVMVTFNDLTSFGLWKGLSGLIG
ncbi:RIP metalloprotease RseP [Sphingobium sufflavum]|uniref:RIP metalloprotease RseP n=1 Tax=Sphingobium sufflavum TaxID=1129547 RepID=UPI001F234FF1|nr:RIP metalloprotease RseP [Sphingobium sufflavum]MCE7798331.1 RIP metalloprotease RseP [Sphingobium sufflavum]